MFDDFVIFSFVIFSFPSFHSFIFLVKVRKKEKIIAYQKGSFFLTLAPLGIILEKPLYFQKKRNFSINFRLTHCGGYYYLNVQMVLWQYTCVIKTFGYFHNWFWSFGLLAIPSFARGWHYVGVLFTVDCIIFIRKYNFWSRKATFHRWYRWRWCAISGIFARA